MATHGDTAAGDAAEVSAEGAAPAPHTGHAPTPGDTAAAHGHRSRSGQAGRFGLVFGVLLVAFGLINLVGPLVPGWVTGAFTGPALVLALGIALVVGATRRTAA